MTVCTVFSNKVRTSTAEYARSRQLAARFGRVPYGDWRQELWVVPGPLTLQPADLDQLAAAGALLAVEGDLTVPVPSHHIWYVQDDLYCRHAQGARLVGGTLHARDFVDLAGEDDEALCLGPDLRLNTPYLFAWFYDLDNVTLPPHTLVFELGSDAIWTRPNPVLRRHAAAFALADDCQWAVESDCYDGPSWHIGAIRERLALGRSILRPGFAVAALAGCAEAADDAQAGFHEAAFRSFRSALQLAPAYYPAWLGMGEALWQAGAYDQALPVFQQAMQVFPRRQRGLVLTAANRAALCALRTRHYALAESLASQAIDHQASAAANPRHAMAYRCRGEARYLAGDVAGAFQDLQTAIELFPQQFAAHWLLGLLYRQRGDLARAADHQQQAIAGDAKFAVPYTTARSTDFLSPAACHVDWQEQSGPPPQRNHDYWLRLLQADPLQLARVPLAARTTDLFQALVDAHPDPLLPWAGLFPASAWTEALAWTLAQRHGGNLACIPPTYISKDLCLATPLLPGGLQPEMVPTTLLDADICRHAVQGGADLQQIPAALLDRAMVEQAVRLHPYTLTKLPVMWQDDAMYFWAMAHADPYFINTQVPSRLKTSAALQNLLTVAKTALQAIPGKLFDAAVYQRALDLYGNAADWPEIVDRHSPDYCRRDPYAHCADDCWEVFWDEEFMLEQIENPNYPLSPYEIPPQRFTAAVAAACFAREPIHLASIPRRWITPAMCAQFIERYPDQLRDVPVALRTVEMGVLALHDNTAQTADLPAAIHAAVFERLWRHHRQDFPQGWLRLERGRGYLLGQPPQLDAAKDDFCAILAAADDDEYLDKHRQEARYLLGYCAYLAGRSDDAERIRVGSSWAETWGTYAQFDPAADKHTVDFALQPFEQHMIDAELAIKAGDLAEAYAAVNAAEQYLQATGQTDTVYWAPVLDYQRWLTFELGLWADNERICRAAISRLEQRSLWHYLRSDYGVRHTLRGCYFRLATLVLEQPQPELEDIETALALARKAMQLGATEDDSRRHPFYQGLAAVLLLAQQHDAGYQAECTAVLAEMAELDLLGQGHVDLPTVVAALQAA